MMSDKNEPKNKAAKPTANFRLVTFEELPTRHKGGGVGAAHTLLCELRKREEILQVSVSDVERHKYVLDEAGEIRGIAICSDLDEDRKAKNWAGPRDVLLWQAMTVNVEGVDEQPHGKAVVKKKRTAEGVPEPLLAGIQPAPGGRVMLAVDAVKPWAGQPRKFFDEAFVRQLAGVMEARGFREAWPLLVRPAGDGYEIADGERRWRASLIAKIGQVPCVVENLTDSEMLEIAMISSIHKKELSPMEEANGLKRMLDEPGQTIESVAQRVKLAPATVGQKVSLARLSGTPVGDALDARKITEEHARLIARIPASVTREQVLEMVLKPTGCPAPMPVSELRRRLTLDFVRELRGAPWKMEDATLVPEELEGGVRVAGGACSDCPSNVPSDGARKAAMCMNPGCFRKKEVAVHERWVAEKEAEGKKALSAAENAKVFGQDGVKLSVMTEYVDLATSPDKADLGAKSDDLPTWGKLVKETGVPIVVALDANGKERALVDRKVAIVAIEERDRALPAEKQMLEGSAKPQKAAGKNEGEAEKKERVLREKAEREREERIDQALRAAIVSAARRPLAKLTDAWLGMALTTLAYRVDEDELAAICVRRGWASDAEGVDTDFMLEKCDELPAHEAVSVLTELLLAATMDLPDFIGDWAAALDVDLKKVRKDEEAKIKAEAKSDAAKVAKANGVRWITPVGVNVEDFRWDESGACKNASCAVVAVGEKFIAHITIARTEKGWVYGFSLEIAGAVQGEQIALKAATYSTPELATVSALTALRQVVERNGGTEDELGKVADYIKAAQKGAK